jgi:prepilin-type N-terminal cleavage/methylation domain-containing protein
MFKNRSNPPRLHVRTRRGFTLIETFVAISILLVAVSSALTLSSRGLAAAFSARDQMIAFYLSQEAIEYVRYIRDGNTLAGANWLTDLSECVGASCTVDVRAASPAEGTALCSGACPVIRFNETSGMYGYDPSFSPTPFTRSISLTRITDDEMLLSVSVSWRSGRLDRSFAAKEYLFNWR